MQQHDNATERSAILAALDRWIRQRPGLDYANYGDATAYRQEQRRITRDYHDAMELIAAVSWRTSIDAAALKTAFARAFSGRLSVETAHSDAGWTVHLDYCTGQYWPTEYRAAAAAVLAKALWEYARHNLPEDTECPGIVLRTQFRREFGRRMQTAWLD